MKGLNNLTFRYLQYYNIVQRLQKQGIASVTSHNLASLCNITASQLRKDFMHLSIQGINKVGYQVLDLLVALEKKVKKDEETPLILVGAGSFGTALINYNNFKTQGFDIVAAFDIDFENKQNFKIPVMHIDDCSSFIKEHNIKLAILTVPEKVAQHTARKLVDAGIDKILNLTPEILNLPSNITVNNINIVIELEYLFLSAINSDNKKKK
ncbi:MAG: hypothetical protein A2Y40_07535 [Candidatus Margulisbacteria bacterium GWF2_35_9]|nr:MAG: hypothetical protein A2Y40_07535 [Candidatus Margulisbacteria bacterium GWF2_35_9]